MSSTYPEIQIPTGQQEERDWALKFCQAIHDNYQNNGPMLFYRKRQKYRENRLWAIGKKSADHLKEMIDMDGAVEVEGEKLNFTKLDFDVQAYIPKFRNVVLGMLMKLDYNIGVNAVDKLSVSKKLQHRHKVQANIILRPLLEQQAPDLAAFAQQGMAQDQGFVSPVGEPMDMEEFELFQQMPPKMREEIAMELFTNRVMSENDWSEVRKSYCENLVDNGVACTKDTLDANGYVLLRNVNVDNFIVDFSERSDFKNAMFMGEVQELTFAELRNAAGTTFTNDEWDSIKGLSSNDYTKAATGKYQVLDVEWRAENTLTVEEKESQHGTTNAYLKPKGYQPHQNSKYKRTVTQAPYPVIYKAKWIVGSDYLFDFGVATDQKRGKRNKKQVDFSFHPYAVNVVEGENKSMVEQMIPIEKAIQLKLVKIQHFIALARPKGIAADVNALQGVLGDMRPLDMIRMFAHTGNQLYKRVNEQGEYANGAPITELENGMSGDVERFANLLERDFASLEEVTGINRIAAASAPKSSDLIGTAKIALSGTDNALAHLFSADTNIVTRSAKGVVMRLPYALEREHVKDYYIDALGEAHTQVLAALDGLQLCEYDVTAEMKPNEAQLAEINQYILNAQAVRTQSGKGGITLSDSIRVREIAKTNIKQAWQYLVLRENKIAEQDAQAQSQMVQENAQAQQASNEQAAQAKMSELEMEMMLKDKLDAAKHERAKELKMLEHKHALEKIEREYTGKAHLQDLDGDIKEDLLAAEVLLYDEKTERRSHNISEVKAGNEIGIQQQ